MMSRHFRLRSELSGAKDSKMLKISCLCLAVSLINSLYTLYILTIKTRLMSILEEYIKKFKRVNL